MNVGEAVNRIAEGQQRPVSFEQALAEVRRLAGHFVEAYDEAIGTGQRDGMLVLGGALWAAGELAYELGREGDGA